MAGGFFLVFLVFWGLWKLDNFGAGRGESCQIMGHFVLFFAWLVLRGSDLFLIALIGVVLLSLRWQIGQLF